MRRMLSLLLPAMALAALIWFRPVALGGSASYIIVSGVSMEPTLHTGDLAVLQKQADYAEGDIVGFWVDNNIVIHRIVGGSAGDGYVVQGDNKTHPDLWQPRPEEIAGRMWVRVPGAGRILGGLRRPPLILALGLAAALALDETQKTTSRQRLRRLRSRLSRGIGTAQSSGGLMDTVTLLVSLTLVLAAVGGYGLYLPINKTEVVERSLYEHTAQFQYTVHMARSELYAGEVIGPISPSSEGLDTPVLTSLAQSIDLDFAYELKDATLTGLHGELSVAMQLRAGEDWAKTELLLAPTPFHGTATSTRVSFDLAQLQPINEALMAQIGYTPSNWQILLIPTVRLTGQIEGQTIDDSYTPIFAIELNTTRVALDSQLTRSEARTVEDQVELPNTVRAVGIAVPVRTLRLVGLMGALIGAIALIGLGGIVFLGVGLNECGYIRARYGHMFVAAADSRLDTTQYVEVASFRDLVRIARRDGGIIFHKPPEGEDWVFFVPDGQLLFTYRVGGTNAED